MITPPRRLNAGERITWAHYNGLLDFVRRTTPVAGGNVSIDYTMGGSVIHGHAGGSTDDGLRPFTVSRDGANLLIYIPNGAVALAGTRVILEHAKDANNNDIADWYVVQDFSASWTEYAVDVHVKGRISTDGGTTIHPAVTASAYSTENYGVDTAAHRVGDVKSATVFAEDSAGMRQLLAETLQADVPAPTLFEAYWKFSNGMLSPAVRGGTWSPSGHQIAVSDADVSGTSAYVVVDFSGQSPSASIQAQAGDTTTTISILIYELDSSGGIVSDDRRSLSNLFLYT